MKVCVPVLVVVHLVGVEDDMSLVDNDFVLLLFDVDMSLVDNDFVLFFIFIDYADVVIDVGDVVFFFMVSRLNYHVVAVGFSS